MFFFLLSFVAFLYASVGHGGASGYLALMSLYGFQPSEIKSTALILNIIVSLISFIFFSKNKKINYKMLLMFLILSVPFAFIGAKIKIETHYYKIILGVLLLFPVIRLLKNNSQTQHNLKKYSSLQAIVFGGVVGFLSGMIGIGGGILLSPFIILKKWADPKKTAALSAMFIFINSVSGLLGLLSKAGFHFTGKLFLYVLFAVVGGIFGAYFGQNKVGNRYIKVMLSMALLIASIKLIFLS